MEQSSLSLASDINNDGFYQVQRLQDQNGTVKAGRISAMLHAVVNVYDLALTDAVLPDTLLCDCVALSCVVLDKPA